MALRQKIVKLYHRFNERGASLPMIAAAIIPMIGAMGGAVDLANVYMVRSQLRDAVDSAALTGGRLYYASDRDAQVTSYFNANLPALTTGNTLKSMTITPGGAGAGTTLTVTAEVNVKTFLMRVLGLDTITTSASATVERRSNGIEVVMALDNTVSMSRAVAGGTTRIQALKDASKDFVATLYGGNTTNPNLKMSIMPYTAYVNVGKILQDEETATGRTYLESIPGYALSDTDPLGWAGCVDEPPTDNTITDTTDPENDALWAAAFDTQEYLPGLAGKPLFKPSLTPPWGGSYTETWGGGVSCYSSFDYYSDGEKFTVPGSDASCVPVPAGPLATPYTVDWGFRYAPNPTWPSTFLRDLSANPGSQPPDASWPAAGLYPASDKSPNLYCPAPTMPLAAHPKAEIDTYLDTRMQAFMGNWSEGTMSNSAMAWAYRMLTPALPLAGAVKTPSTEKVIVMMTDGYLSQPSDGNVRTGYGYPAEKQLFVPAGEDAAQWAEKAHKVLGARLARECVLAKRAGIKIYTVTFTVPSTDWKAQVYKDCASDPKNYFSPTNAAALKDAFNKIAADLTSIRLTK